MYRNWIEAALVQVVKSPVTTVFKHFTQYWWRKTQLTAQKWMDVDVCAVETVVIAVEMLIAHSAQNMYLKNNSFYKSVFELTSYIIYPSTNYMLRWRAMCKCEIAWLDRKLPTWMWDRFKNRKSLNTNRISMNWSN